MIKVAIVDDQPLMVQGLSMIVGHQEDMEVIWCANEGEEAVYKCEQQSPHVILMDIRMPNMNGVEATKRIKLAHPEVQVLILTTFMEDEDILESLRFGASGYLLKDATPERIVEAIRTAIVGGTIIEPLVASKLLKHLKPIEKETSKDESMVASFDHLLTEREKLISLAVAEGYSNKEIAQKLFVSEGTIKNHLTSILDKLELRDRTQLAIYMLKHS